ncbi:hypothetical protein [Pseudobacteriovorax antillogorgiicola]|uniref:Uncharacterized protein n=1 Tax=Pseudobacteriovorax antillogorgiicola TaxID=1513793 RepID=A0A1Y6BDT3_9BACT|nr:hypothetical protein [Pseudobacteriovorax antillogorgiicola]TCS58654.1 hypothetical protein EDD56_102167 [Pseudobacteriovorax antillogorgiicola]SME96298.1 hypothetical protein SAMN06296036_102276 [Pseudobacteriovorax antillogorgiicola]
MWFRIILTATALGLVLYLQFCFDFNAALKEQQSQVESQTRYSANR